MSSVLQKDPRIHPPLTPSPYKQLSESYPSATEKALLFGEWVEAARETVSSWGQERAFCVLRGLEIWHDFRMHTHQRLWDTSCILGFSPTPTAPASLVPRRPARFPPATELLFMHEKYLRPNVLTCVLDPI